MKKILITGGAGFIGLNLAHRLSQSNKIVIVDNFTTGSRELAAQLPTSIKVIESDVIDFDFNSLSAIDEIYHLACPASPPKYQENPLHTLDTSYVGSKRVLDFSLKQACKIIFSSTSEVYGDPQINPQPEDYTGNVSTLTSRACYDEGKRIAETLCYEYKRLGCDVRIARIFNTYGPLMDPQDGRVVSNFIAQALTHQPLSIYGTGQQTRSFCYIDDMVEALVRLMAVACNELPVINLGNDDEHSIMDIAHFISQLLGVSVNFEHLPLPEADPSNRRPDLTRAKQLLNWSPKTPLSEGLEKTIEYFTTQLDIDPSVIAANQQ